MKSAIENKKEEKLIAKTAFPHLFTPVKIGSIEVRNRLAMPPMGTCFATRDGFVTDRTIAYYEARAKGGMGLIIVEIGTVDFPLGMCLFYGQSIDDDKYIPGMSRLAKTIKAQGACAALQIFHTGMETRREIAGTTPVGPSAVKAFGGEIARELSTADIKRIVDKFAQAAVRVKRAGFDAVELHGATYYLIAQFLSRHWNKRQDRYGGSIENRARFMVEVTAAVREAVGPDFTMWVRLNGTEFGMEDGLTLEEAKQAAKMAVKAGANAIHVSSFGGVKQPHMGPTVLDHNILMPLAAEIKKVVSVPVIAVGRVDLDYAEEAIRDGKVDVVAIGRGVIADPDLPNKAAAGKVEDIRPCISCLECINHVVYQGVPLKCSVNPIVGMEKEIKLRKDGVGKKVLIVGGGPAGLEAARVAASRGCKVVLYEKRKKLGGQLLAAAVPPYKGDINKLAAYLENQARKAGVEIISGKEITPKEVEALKPDGVIISGGIKPIIPDIKGLDKAKPVTAEAVLTGEAKVGERVLIIGGGMVGCETADYLVSKGKKVTVVEILDKLASDVMPVIRSTLLRRLRDNGAVLLTGVKVGEIAAGKMILTDRDGKKQEIAADTVVLAAGGVPASDAFAELEGKVQKILFAGDAVKARGILEAIEEGNRAGRNI